MLKTVLAVALLCAFTINAEARQRHKATGLHPDCNITMPCAPSISPAAVTEGQRVARGKYIANHMGFGGVVEKRAVRAPKSPQKPYVCTPRQAEAGECLPLVKPQRLAATIVSHPIGCPSRAFCGCGAAVRVFGSPVRSLWLAANWLRFPRAAPAPGMVAARRGHVFVLEADLGGGLWRVYDANSGGGQTRVHARSLAGYQIVNPRAG